MVKLVQKSYRLAFCSIISALSGVTMILTGIIPIGTYALPAISGALLLPIIIEVGCKHAFYSYIVTSLLSIILAADKEAVILFILFLGYYPILKFALSKLKFKFLRLIIKFLIFNTTTILSYLIAVNILLIPQDTIVIEGIPLPYLMLIFSNIVFLMYDYSIHVVTIMYVLKIRPKLIIPPNGPKLPHK